jgi:hypothetical protein
MPATNYNKFHLKNIKLEKWAQGQGTIGSSAILWSDFRQSIWWIGDGVMIQLTPILNNVLRTEYKP